jgi:hypothetical protein
MTYGSAQGILPRLAVLLALLPASAVAEIALPPLPPEAPPPTARDFAPERRPARGEAFRALIEAEARRRGVPAALVEAVVRVESGYDPGAIGGVGEIGLMQVRPSTAAMMGFRGTDEELAEPAVNIRYGAEYLAGAWRLAGGDLCRTLMKYRAGHGEEIMTVRSVAYCQRARAYLAEMGSPLGSAVLPVGMDPGPVFTRPVTASAGLGIPIPPVLTRLRMGATFDSNAFWTARARQVERQARRAQARRPTASSEDFWAARARKVRAIEARLSARAARR